MPRLHLQVDNQILKESLNKSIFVLSRSHDILFIKRIENLLKIAGMKFEL